MIARYFIHGALADVGAHDVDRGRGAAALEERQGVFELAEFLPGQNPELVEFAAVVPSAIDVVQTIERCLDLAHRLGVRLQVRTLARQEISALARFRVVHERAELAQGLLPQLRDVHALIGRIETRLAVRREEEQADEKTDQQKRR